MHKLYKRPGSDVWQVALIGRDGRRTRRSTRTTDPDKAAQLAAKWDSESWDARNLGIRPPYSFAQLMTDYLTGNADKRSIETDRYRTRTIRRHIADGADMRQFGPRDVRDYIALRRGDEASNGTINRELALLSSAIGYVNSDLDMDLPNPIKGRMLSEPEGRTRWITREESERLIEAAKRAKKVPFLSDFITLALYTGCRRSELLDLEWSRVDLSAGLLHLGAEHTKSGKRRSVPLSARAREAVLSRRNFRERHCPEAAMVFVNEEGEPIRDFRWAFAQACERAGIEDFRIHDMRHTCAAWLVTSGAPLAEIRDLLGHSTVMMTEKYAHLAPETLKSTVARLDAQEGAWHTDDTVPSNVVKMPRAGSA
jgi:integrase